MVPIVHRYLNKNNVAEQQCDLTLKKSKYSPFAALVRILFKLGKNNVAEQQCDLTLNKSKYSPFAALVRILFKLNNRFRKARKNILF